MFWLGALLGLLCGGTIGTLVMALVAGGARSDK